MDTNVIGWDSRTTVLKLAYDGLGLAVSVEKFEDRLRLQKGMYLVQRAGFDLGYRFAWFDKGPFSSKLAEHYHQVVSWSEFEMPKDISLKSPAIEAIGRARSMFGEVPEGLESEEWMELLASLDYLRKVSRCSEEDIDKVLKSEKSKLVGLKSTASEVLTKYGLA